MSTNSHTAQLLFTLNFAAQKHATQRRKDPEQTPYINHPIIVANALAEAGVDDLATLQAAILHDTVEDTETTLDELTKVFGAEVSKLVEECTDDKHLSKDERKRLQIVTAKSKSEKARRVKLADKLSNLRDLQRVAPVGWTKERVQEYFIWAKNVTDECAGACPKIEEQLKEIYAGTFRYNGSDYRCIPKDME
ncbi:guanosine-3',5'-bis 3'-pyrophosphohydrolase MESH1-like protein [Basidiobolus meristosporus CBS 931.73]|uniref:Guanosine-3',5'-bis(diphosphate) 3'-pyrophosphohydrolase MESH1 n=1 Tax=Basidiobolus meristosporus CBS 931.73 TaxID=1314790 RepID=A0A1Y1Y9A1_9FUNG|nr:guanosine-3',5'-bis 3'-pyrophosphohydrolase MESH1-like protein [Basidiobolus meristosporus CBS 931.73]|eukprot:ORX94316.1 guanosine-3',5'-bis 3'-pyrophosphohydrolase MESH1-like protein [Basidiobolus meristosporus CBS 931.73]